MIPGFVRRHPRKLGALAFVLATPLFLHAAVGALTRISPPAITTPRYEARDEAGIRRAGPGWTTIRGIRLVHLEGKPEEIGAEHSALLYEPMIANERVLWDGFGRMLPFAPARVLLFDVARFKYRAVESSFPLERKNELAAEAAGFAPDPYDDRLPTYHRMVMLHALYDVALGFEHSPLLGCTAFGLGPEATADGHVLFARAFDFDVADIFDRDKAVFLVHPEGKIPFASVAWPGFVGVVTGINAEGVALAVHGGRAREPTATGMPVPFAMRRVLEEARDVGEAVALLMKQPVMVSHIVFLGDASGHFAVVERAPGSATAFRYDGKTAVTNHFQGELASDPRDAEVRRTTTTVARRERIDELLAGISPKTASVAKAVAMLRDHTCAHGEACPLGDRRAIDAFIATHGVVADLTERALWVSEGPHLSGRFVKVAPSMLVRRDMIPSLADELETIPADEVLSDGRYTEGRARAGAPLLGREAGMKSPTASSMKKEER